MTGGHDTHGGSHGHGGGHGTIDDPIKAFYDQLHKINSWVETHEVAHSSVYTAAAKEILKKKKGRGLDLKLLEDADVRKKFIDRIVELYLAHAKEVHGVEIPQGDDDEFSKSDLLYLMSGHTRQELEENINGAKGNYTLAAHREMTKEHVKALRGRHEPLAMNLIKDKKHKGALLAYMGLEKLVGTSEEPDHNEVISKFARYVGSAGGAERYQALYGGNDHAHDSHGGGHH